MSSIEKGLWFVGVHAPSKTPSVPTFSGFVLIDGELFELKHFDN
jgi:hypothetical protein